MSNSVSKLVVVIGLPGSGKTTLVERMMSNWNRGSIETNASSVDIDPVLFYELCDAIETSSLYYISVDKLVSTEDQAAMSNQRSGKWKDFRKRLIASTEAFIIHLSNTNSNGQLNSDEQRLLNAICSINHLTSSHKKFTLLIEDNMYFKSMRDNWHRLAKKYALGFGIIYLNTPLTVCMIRNDKRLVNKVPDDIIKKMNDEFEVPENNEFTIYVDQDINGVLQSIIFVCSLKPVPQDESSEMMKKESQLITMTNLAHQFDILLRDVIGCEMKMIKDKTLLEQLAPIFKNKKQVLLAKLRCSDLFLPQWLTKYLIELRDPLNHEMAKSYARNLILEGMS